MSKPISYAAVVSASLNNITLTKENPIQANISVITKEQCIDHVKQILEDAGFTSAPFPNEKYIQKLPDMYYRKEIIRDAIAELNQGIQNKRMVRPTFDQAVDFCVDFIEDNDAFGLYVDEIQRVEGMYMRKNTIMAALYKYK
jgi:hypothetical protein